MDTSENSWSEWSKVVLNELERLNDGFGKLTTEFQNFKVEVAKEIASKKEVDALKEEFSQYKINSIQEVNTVKAHSTQEITAAKTELYRKIVGMEKLYGNQLTALQTEFKIKAGLWGAVGSLLGVLVAVAIALLGG